MFLPPSYLLNFQLCFSQSMDDLQLSVLEGELCSESRDEVTQDESFSQLLILIIHAEEGRERCMMSSWRPYKCRKGGQSEAPWDISALVTYMCVAITEFLLKPVYRKEGR